MRDRVLCFIWGAMAVLMVLAILCVWPPMKARVFPQDEHESLPPSTEWLGAPVFRRQFEDRAISTADIVVGLRDDGVVVWRRGR